MTRPMLMLLVLGAAAICVLAWCLYVLGSQRSYVVLERRKIRPGEEELLLRVPDGTVCIVRGSSTAWRWYPTGYRCGTMVESRIVDALHAYEVSR